MFRKLVFVSSIVVALVILFAVVMLSGIDNRLAQAAAISPLPPIQTEVNASGSTSTIVSAPHVPGVILVKLRANDMQKVSRVGRFAVSDLQPVFADDKSLALLPESVAENYGLKRIFRIHIGNDADFEKTLSGLKLDPAVEYAEPDYLAHAAFTPNDPKFADQWGAVKINLPTAWNTTQGSAMVTIAIVDTGIEMTHPDLATKLWVNPGETPGNGVDDDGNGYVDDVYGWNWVDNSNAPTDDIGHGSHVAGIAAAATHNGVGIAGVCPTCRIMPLKVLDAAGNGSYSNIAAGILYAANKGAKVINLSLGGYADSQLLRDALAVASTQAVIVAAAGNDNRNVNFYPAAYNDYVIAVAATDQANHKAPFSNYGSWVDISAPGVSILSTIFGGAYDSWSGSSMAAPFVSGVAGLVRSQNSAWSAGAVRGQILNSALALDSINPDYAGQLGVGLVEANKALTTVGTPMISVAQTTVNGVISGQVNVDSTATLSVTLANRWSDVVNLTAVLHTTDPFVTVLDDSDTYGALLGYQNKGGQGGFQVQVANNAPFAHKIPFSLALTGTGFSASVPFTLTTEGSTIEVSGVITENQTWTPERDYLLTKNVVVNQGVTLTIQAGTIVRALENKLLRVDGTLQVLGTTDNPVRFEGEEICSPPDEWMPEGFCSSLNWGGIRFSDFAVDATFDGEQFVGGNTVQFANFERANACISASGVSLYIANNTFTDCQTGFEGSGPTVRIENNTFQRGQNGVFAWLSDSSFSNTIIQDNVFLDSSQSAINVEAGNSPVIIRRNRISTSWTTQGTAISTGGSGFADVSGNLISGYRTGANVSKNFNGRPKQFPTLTYGGSPDAAYWVAYSQEGDWVDGWSPKRILANRLNEHGTVIGPTVAVGDQYREVNKIDAAYSPDTNAYLTVWNAVAADKADDWNVYARLIGADGSLPSSEVQVSAVTTETSNSYYPSIAYNTTDQEFMVAWAENEPGGWTKRLWIQRLNLDGDKIGDPQILATDTMSDSFSVDQSRLVFNSIKDEYLAVWKSDVGQGGIATQRISTTGQPLGTPKIIATNKWPDYGNPEQPSVSYNLTDGGYLVTFNAYKQLGNEYYQSVFALQFDGMGPSVGNITTIMTGTQSANYYSPQIAYNSDQNEFLVIANREPGNQRQVYAQRVTPTGQPLGQPFGVSTGLNWSNLPSVDYSPSTNSFLSLWQENREGQVYLQEIGPTGILLDNPDSGTLETDPIINFPLVTRSIFAYNTIMDNRNSNWQCTQNEYNACAGGLLFNASSSLMLQVYGNTFLRNTAHDVATQTAADFNMPGNYWGTTDEATLRAHIYDCEDQEFGCALDATVGHVYVNPVLPVPDPRAPGLLTWITLNPVSPVPSGPLAITLDFSKPMDPSVPPTVTFGPHAVRTGSWVSPTQWVGTYPVNQYTGDGLQTLRVSGAKGSDDGMVVPEDNSFTFTISTMGASATNVEQAYGRVALHWSPSDLPTLAGYNVYRKESAGAWDRLNSDVIRTTSYTDTQVINGTPYIYKITVISTDLFETDYSSELNATPDDYSLPNTPAVADAGATTNYINRLYANWSSQDPESGIAEYQYAIGTASGNTDVVNWTSVGAATEITRTNLSLQNGVTYFFSVKARNGADKWSAVGASNGILVQWLASPTVSQVAPASGLRTLENTITITGTNLRTDPLPVVRLGSRVLDSVVRVSASKLRATVPAGILPGIYDLSVVNWDGQVAMLTTAYTATNPVAGTATITLDPANSFAAQGEERQVRVMIADAQDLAGFQFEIRYDPAVIQVNYVSMDWFLGSNGRNSSQVGPTIDNGTGRVSFGGFSYGSGAGANGSGPIATINFMASANSGSSSNISLENVTLIDTINTQMPSAAQAGLLQVVTYPFGDFDHDCGVTVSDVMMVAQRWNQHSGDWDFQEQYDFDHNGIIDIADIMQVANVWNTSCDGISPTPTGRSAVTDGLQDGIQITSALPGELVTMLVHAEDVKEMTAYQAALVYDPALLAVVRVETLAPWDAQLRQSIELPLHTESGRITFGRFSFGQPQNLSGDSDLVYITLKSLQSGTTSVYLKNSLFADGQGQSLGASTLTVQVVENVLSSLYLPMIVR